MTISKDVLDRILSTIDDDAFRNSVTEALTRESTELSDITGEVTGLTAYLGEVDFDELSGAEPEALRRDLHDLEEAMARLTLAFYDLVEKVDPLASG